MFRKLTAVLLSALLLAMLLPLPALAVGDTTPPELVSISLDKTVLVLGDTLTLTVDVIEAESGLSFGQCCAGFYRGDNYGDSAWGREIDADTVSFTFNITEYWVSGEYHLSSLRLIDNQGNEANLTVENGSLDSGYIVKVDTGDANPDKTGPAILSYKVDKTNIGVGGKLKFTVRTTDPAGILVCRIGIFELSYFWSTYFYLDLVPGSKDTYSGTFTIPSEMYDSTYFWQVDVCDNKYNGSYTISSDQIRVNNPSNVFVYAEPKLTEFKADQSVKAGDTVTFSIKVNLNGLKCNQADLQQAILQLYRQGSQSIENYHSVQLKKNKDCYTGSFTVPASWPDTAIVIGRISFILGQSYYLELTWPSQYYKNGKFVGASVKLNSVFSGVENCMVPVGASFDPLAGVHASNNSEGDMTGKIEVSSNVDTNMVGLYLVKYKVLSPNAHAIGATAYYYDFRWVGVSAVIPDSTLCDPGTLVLAGGDVGIETNGCQAILTKDGKAITFDTNVSAPGKYAVSLADGSSKTGRFTIDNSGPAISATYQGNYPSALIVTAACKDVAGLAETRWQAGNVSLETIRRQGAVFRNNFTAKQFGDYTIYARDKLGNESTKKITLSYTAVSGVSLNASSAKLAAGQTFQLKPSFSPATCTFQNVIWSSSNPVVARVDANGLVTAKAAGTARIVARTCDGGKIATCTVSVAAPVAVTSVVISSASKTVPVGSAFALTASVRPTNAAIKTIVWSSSNNRVVAVAASGSFRAVGVGTAYIYAKAHNGKYAVCKIIVTAS